jgi:hypothetical protein
VRRRRSDLRRWVAEGGGIWLSGEGRRLSSVAIMFCTAL